MELLVYLALAIAAFSGLVAFVVGLLSAPTPVLAAILIVGLLLTQKSIDNLNQKKINLVDEKEKAKIEKVEVAIAPYPGEKIAAEGKNSNLMQYRGLNYKRHPNLEKTSTAKTKVKIKYRGISREV